MSYFELINTFLVSYIVIYRCIVSICEPDLNI